ncbi:MAG: cytochrome c-type biogenesis protein CcmH, partial [Rhodoferax sp.]
MSKLLVAIVMAFVTGAGQSAEPGSAPGTAQHDRMVAITSELRCLVCQNQTIADSHAALAVDLRDQVVEKLKAGFSDQQIL